MLTLLSFRSLYWAPGLYHYNDHTKVSCTIVTVAYMQASTCLTLFPLTALHLAAARQLPHSLHRRTH